MLTAEGSAHGLSGLAALTARLLSVPGAPVTVQVSLLTDVQTVVAAAGELPPEPGARSPLDDSLCTVTARHAQPLLVPDAPADARVAALPPVRSGTVGAYLGVPMLAVSRECIGALCAHTTRAREWSASDVALLEEMAAAMAVQLELRALTGEYAASRVRWDIALEAAEVGSFELDLETGRLEWDERMHELFGYEPGQFPGDLDAGMRRIVEQDREQVLEAMTEAVSSVDRFFVEYRVQLPDGRERWHVSRGRALRWGAGAVRLVGIAQDITEVRTARDEAARLLEHDDDRLLGGRPELAGDLRQRRGLPPGRHVLVRAGRT